MSYNKATLVVMALLLVLAVAYGWEATSFHDMRNRNSVGPSYFPVALAVILALLCIVSAVQSLVRADTRVELPNMPLIAATVALTGAFLIVWAMLGAFYLGGFVLMLSLIFLYDPVFTPRAILRNLAVAISVILFTYLLFGLLIQIRF